MTAAAFSPALAATAEPPVMAARAWIAGRSFPPETPLINLSQAAPVDPPPEPLREAIAEAALNDPQAHLYGPVLGLPALREAVAERWSAHYRAAMAPEAVAITSGCNQAFCAAVATLAGAGDEVILPSPWYFNHRMWLDMAGVATRPLPCDEAGLPSPERAAALIGPRTRAVVLVTPNNPTGAEYPAGLLAAFRDLCAERGLALVLDETYRDFHSADGPPHDLFAEPSWGDTVIQLYSFSKVYRLTGHRVGAMLAAPARLAQAEKFLDTTTICPNQLGQIAALAGIRRMGNWVAGERLEILRRRDALRAGFATEGGVGPGGWRLLSSGAYFAYLAHPFDAPSDVVAKALADQANLLVLPGTMFNPLRGEGGDGTAEATLRLAFANADAAGLSEVLRRLAAFRL